MGRGPRQGSRIGTERPARASSSRRTPRPRRCRSRLRPCPPTSKARGADRAPGPSATGIATRGRCGRSHQPGCRACGGPRRSPRSPGHRACDAQVTNPEDPPRAKIYDRGEVAEPLSCGQIGDVAHIPAPRLCGGEVLWTRSGRGASSPCLVVRTKRRGGLAAIPRSRISRSTRL